MNDKLSLALGLLRDFVAAALGVLILFGVNLSDEQVAGLLLLVVTGGALGTFVVQQWKKDSKSGEVFRE